MILFKKSDQLKRYIQQARNRGLPVGFVPTMGALHQGHLSLVQASQRENGLTVTSIFVNPAQFNDPGDFAKYPITIEKDIELLSTAGNDVLFLPSVTEIYPNGTHQSMVYPLGDVENILEGKYRPGHFQGVSMVMHRLLDIVGADNLYMGQKDYQQCMVVNRLLDLIHSSVHLYPCPTLREKDGLAMSSRNLRLNPDQRQRAAGIFSALNYLKKSIIPGPTEEFKRGAMAILLENDFKIDYVEVANSQTLQTVAQWDGKEKIVGLIAAFQQDVRLIDNMLLNGTYQ